MQTIYPIYSYIGKIFTTIPSLSPLKIVQDERNEEKNPYKCVPKVSETHKK